MSQAELFLSYPVFRRLAYWLALYALTACGHTEPFTPRDFNTDQPFNPSPPVQLTLNLGPDRRAAWLPDGSGILYSSQQMDTEDNDVCLALLPPTGGRQRTRTCTFSIDGNDFTESLESAAAQADGRLAYISAVSFIDALAPNDQSLVLASLGDPVTRAQVLSIPYTIPGRPTHLGISQLHWLSPDRLLYLGENVRVSTPCQFCQMDTLRSGLDAVSLSVGAGNQPEAIPGTDNASGVSPGSNADEIYYTLNGDTRVYRQTLSTGDIVVAHDFGVAGIARDVHVSGNRLTAVVGGRVHFANDPALGPIQWDSGGYVHVVELSNGSDTPLSGPSPLELYRRPRLSPGAATRLVTERYPLDLFEVRAPDGSLIRVDTIVARAGDLYLFGQP